MRFLLPLLCLFMVTTAMSQVRTAHVQAAGLTCAMCSRAIYQSLIDLPFVKEVTPDLKESSFLLIFRDSVLIEPDAIRRQIEDAGFSIARFSFDLTTVSGDPFIGGIWSVQGMQLILLRSTDPPSEIKGEVVFVDRGFLTDKQYKPYESAIGSARTDKAQPSTLKRYHVVIEK